MSYYDPDSVDAAVEQPSIALLAELGWQMLNWPNKAHEGHLPKRSPPPPTDTPIHCFDVSSMTHCNVTTPPNVQKGLFS